MRHDFFDRFSRLDSPIHHLPSYVKLLIFTWNYFYSRHCANSLSMGLFYILHHSHSGFFYE